MARTKNNERSANRVAVDVGATGKGAPSKGAIIVLAISVIAALWAVAMMTKPGRVGYVYFFTYTEYYIGVVTLVSLSITIMIGLVSTDRLVLSIRQRVLLQSAHRTTGVIAVTSLFLHVWMKIVEKHASVIDAFIPFLHPGYNKVWVGLGTISGWVMVLVMWTGIARSRFIGRGSPWMWRGIHAVSYLIWPTALMHGLSAGRPAATWVVVSYIVCVLAVLVGLAVRLSVSLNRRKDFASPASTGALKPVGSMVPTSSAAMKRPGRRDKPAPVEPQTLGPVAVVDSFRPAANAVTAPPVAPPPMDDDLVAPRPRRARAEEMYDEPTGMMPQYDEERPRRGGRRVEDEIEYDEPRGRRYPGEDTSTRMRRPGPDETGTRMRLDDTGTRMRRLGPDETGTRMRRPGPDETGTRMRRPELEDTGTRMRRDEIENTGTRMRFDDYDEPAPRRRRYAEEEEPAPRSRRRGDMPLSEAPARGDYDEVPRQRAARYEDDYEEAPRGRRGDDSGRHSRAGFVDGDGYVEADETPTLVDMAPRRRGGRDEPSRVDAGRGGRRGGRGRDDEPADDGYWSQLRGEAN
ncbi:translation initiation factor III [Actinoplanes sp. TRM 88003]|uniref:Translation initiation factor III n=1 Tax=Paractinoplanes aksuensis TaxID=2939490 RepID=A0ABT1DK38_9ACTN|nr:translation initiation factor III [Actinoplanes aksuensis]MCO8271192.1 translation initiation factor III [Actinoplanes aksuensis]